MHMKGHIDKWCKQNCDPAPRFPLETTVFCHSTDVSCPPSPLTKILYEILHTVLHLGWDGQLGHVYMHVYLTESRGIFEVP